MTVGRIPDTSRESTLRLSLIQPVVSSHQGELMNRIAAGLASAILTATLVSCAQAPAVALTQNSGDAGSVGVDSGAQPSGSLKITAAAQQLTLRHWSTSALSVVLEPRGRLSGPVSLRLERADGESGDVIEVTPGTVTLNGQGSAALTLKLRPTQVAFPAPGGAQPWRLVASQGSRELSQLPLSLTLEYADFTFSLGPVTAREGQTVSATLTVDAASREVPPFTFSLSPYIPDEQTQYELVGDPQRPAQYRVTSLPATFQVPLLLKSFPGVQLPPAGAIFQLSVDGLDSLGSARYAPKWVRANLIWNLAR